MEKMEKSERIKELVELLNKAGRAYYQDCVRQWEEARTLLDRLIF